MLPKPPLLKRPGLSCICRPHLERPPSVESKAQGLLKINFSTDCSARDMKSLKAQECYRL